jgi:hypothetical protein
MFFEKYRCAQQTHGECDCPKCQGYCECTQLETKRIPLTEHQIEFLAVKHAPPIDPAFAVHDDYIEFARAIERAHGIGVEK